MSLTSALRTSLPRTWLGVLGRGLATTAPRAVASESSKDLGNVHGSKPNTVDLRGTGFDGRLNRTFEEGVTGEHAGGMIPPALSSDTRPSATSKHQTKAAETHFKGLSLTERDARLKEILDDRSGEGGVAGLELEDGVAVAMKRGVRDNMFRYI